MPFSDTLIRIVALFPFVTLSPTTIHRVQRACPRCTSGRICHLEAETSAPACSAGRFGVYCGSAGEMRLYGSP